MALFPGPFFWSGVVMMPYLSSPLIAGEACVVSLSPNPAAMLSAREASSQFTV